MVHSSFYGFRSSRTSGRRSHLQTSPPRKRAPFSPSVHRRPMTAPTLVLSRCSRDGLPFPAHDLSRTPLLSTTYTEVLVEANGRVYAYSDAPSSIHPLNPLSLFSPLQPQHKTTIYNIYILHHTILLQTCSVTFM